MEDYRQRQLIIDTMNAERAAAAAAAASKGGVKEVEGNEAETIAKESSFTGEVWPVQDEAGSGRHVEAAAKPAVYSLEEKHTGVDGKGVRNNEDVSNDPLAGSKWPVEYNQLAALAAGGANGSSELSCMPMRVVTNNRGQVVARYVVPYEPLIPRPIVSVHVRQGDKATEMRLLPFDAYMLAAHRLRAHQPFLDHVWLSTEMQVRG